ncbi:hypothetical protein QJS66_12575 [Kocuria rhizophila]|nr:hypothetical protein QJS66_12575 [Kocuria rhizophila]
MALRYTAQDQRAPRPHPAPPVPQATWTVRACPARRTASSRSSSRSGKKPPMWEQLGWPIQECLTYND